MGDAITVDAFIAAIVGGLGTIGGAVAGALLVGISELLGALVVPGTEKAVIYVVVALVTIVRPTGLFSGLPEVDHGET